MRKILYLLMFLFLVSPAFAANDKPVVMNVKHINIKTPTAKGLKKLKITLIKQPKLKEQGLVKSVEVKDKKKKES